MNSRTGLVMLGLLTTLGFSSFMVPIEETSDRISNVLAVAFTVLTLRFSITTKVDVHQVSQFEKYTISCVVMLFLITFSHSVFSGGPPKVFNPEKQVEYEDYIELADNIAFGVLSAAWIVWNIYYGVSNKRKKPKRKMANHNGVKVVEVFSTQEKLKTLQKTLLAKEGKKANKNKMLITWKDSWSRSAVKEDPTQLPKRYRLSFADTVTESAIKVTSTTSLSSVEKKTVDAAEQFKGLRAKKEAKSNSTSKSTPAHMEAGHAVQNARYKAASTRTSAPPSPGARSARPYHNNDNGPIEQEQSGHGRKIYRSLTIDTNLGQQHQSNMSPRSHTPFGSETTPSAARDANIHFFKNDSATAATATEGGTGNEAAATAEVGSAFPAIVRNPVAPAAVTAAVARMDTGKRKKMAQTRKKAGGLVEFDGPLPRVNSEV